MTYILWGLATLIGSIFVGIVHASFRAWGFTLPAVAVAIVLGVAHELLFGYAQVKGPSFIVTWFVASALLAFVPLIINALVFHEHISATQYCGIAIVIGGAYLIGSEALHGC